MPVCTRTPGSLVSNFINNVYRENGNIKGVCSSNASYIYIEVRLRETKLCSKSEGELTFTKL